MKLVFEIVMSLAVGSILSTSCNRSDSADSNSSLTGRSKQDQSNFEIPNNNASEAIDPNGTYVVIAKDLDSGKEFLQTGDGLAQAMQRAIDLCQLRSGLQPVCAVVRQFALQTAPLIPNGDVDGGSFKSYVCLTREFTNPPSTSDRFWAGAGKTASDAKSAALKKCEEKGGIECRIVKCSNADYNKEIIN
jgi:hypothetical protein